MQSQNCYAHDRRNISDFMNRTKKKIKFKQTTAHVCLTHEAHTIGLLHVFIGLFKAEPNQIKSFFNATTVVPQ